MENDEKVNPEFDEYAPSYAELLDDPVRNRFAQYPIHFPRRKWLLIKRLLNRAAVNPATLQMAGCRLRTWRVAGAGRGRLRPGNGLRPICRHAVVTGIGECPS